MIRNLMVRFVTYECMFVIREIVETMVNAYTPRIFSGQKPVFDGREKLYSREPLPFGKDKVSPCPNHHKNDIVHNTGTSQIMKECTSVFSSYR